MYMNEVQRDKYDILDLIFTFLISLCMIVSAIVLLGNFIVSLIYIVIVIFLTLVVFSFWRAQNPFNIYLIRAFSFNNFLFTLVGLIVFYSLTPPITNSSIGYEALLFPSVVYLLISLKFSPLYTRRDKRAGAMLAYTGRSKAARNLFFADNPEERKKREELIAKQKKEYNYKIIIVLIVVLTLSSFTALTFGFY